MLLVKGLNCFVLQDCCFLKVTEVKKGYGVFLKAHIPNVLTSQRCSLFEVTFPRTARPMENLLEEMELTGADPPPHSSVRGNFTLGWPDFFQADSLTTKLSFYHRPNNYLRDDTLSVIVDVPRNYKLSAWGKSFLKSHHCTGHQHGPPSLQHFSSEINKSFSKWSLAAALWAAH